LPIASSPHLNRDSVLGDWAPSLAARDNTIPYLQSCD